MEILCLFYNFFNINIVYRLRLCCPSGRGALTGAMRGRGLSYRQLHSLRSFASGYDCIALRAGNAACGSSVAPFGRYGGGGLSYRQLRSLRSLASGY